MNNFIEYVCRSVIRSEDAICRLNKNVAKLAKCVRITDARVTCVALGGLCIAAVVAWQDQEIKALKKQVADLTKDADDADDTTENTEEQTQQEGA